MFDSRYRSASHFLRLSNKHPIWLRIPILVHPTGAPRWVFQKARILAIFDDLDTILLMIPLKARSGTGASSCFAGRVCSSREAVA